MNMNIKNDNDEQRAVKMAEQDAKKKTKEVNKNKTLKVIKQFVWAVIFSAIKTFAFILIGSLIVTAIVKFLTGGGRRRWRRNTKTAMEKVHQSQ